MVLGDAYRLPAINDIPSDGSQFLHSRPAGGISARDRRRRRRRFRRRHGRLHYIGREERPRRNRSLRAGGIAGNLDEIPVIGNGLSLFVLENNVDGPHIVVNGLWIVVENTQCQFSGAISEANKPMIATVLG